MIVADDGETIVNRIDELLKSVNKTREDVYSDLSIKSNMSDWKKRNTIPSADTMLKIADYLNVSVKFLLTGKDDIFPPKKRKLLNCWDNLEEWEQEILLTEIQAVSDRIIR